MRAAGIPNLHEFGDAAHSLRSFTVMVGAARLARVCELLGSSFPHRNEIQRCLLTSNPNCLFPSNPNIFRSLD